MIRARRDNREGLESSGRETERPSQKWWEMHHRQNYFQHARSHLFECTQVAFPTARTNDQFSKNISPAPVHSELQGQITIIQLCSNYVQLCWSPHPDIVRRDGETLAPIAISDTESTRINVLQLYSIELTLLSIVQTPILRLDGVVFGAQSLI